MKVNDSFFSEDVTFRYRSTKAILEYSELEKSEIYFCPFNEEDDIFEGTLNLYWQADEILWDSFFSHYLLVFGWYYSQFLLLDEGERKIPNKIEWRVDRKNFHIERAITDFLDTRVVKSVKELAMKDNHKVQPDELKVYLKMINRYAFNVISNMFNPDEVYIDKSQGFEIGDFQSFDDTEKKFLTLNLVLEKYEAKILDDSKIDPIIRWFLVEFPSEYYKIIPEMTFPQWYVASFCKNCNDGRNWAQYGDCHKGVCLIFKTHVATNGRGVKLKVCREYSSSQGKQYKYYIEQLKTVTYMDNNPEFNFFDMLGTMPGGIVDSWMKDDLGNASKYYKPRGTFENQKWIREYWEFFENIVTSKSNDWDGLEEERIVFENDLMECYDSVEKRQIQYDFNDLKGIIFGYNISKEDKKRIKKIIDDKCVTSDRKDFEFYNAAKDHKTGKIFILKEI